MKKPKPQPMRPAGTQCPRAGSALLLTILTVSLLLVLTLGFVAMIRMELRATGNRQQTLSAEKNAGLALELAIAALQEHTGPDQRVTAPADLRIPAGVTVTPPNLNVTRTDITITSPGTSGAAAKTLIDTYWTGQRNRHWVGAYRNGNTSVFNPANPPAFNAIPTLERWLVSGNESSPNAFDPNVQMTGLTAASSPRDEIRDANNRIHRLLVKRTAGVETAADLNRAVTAPQVVLAQNGTTLGNIAWWVGDEGIKARSNLVDPFAGDSTEPDHASNQARRRSAQRPILEILPDLQPYYPANDALLGRPVAPTQMGMLNADPAYQANLKARYHELSLVSRGVLANAKHGGLKGDLTHILSRQSAGDFRDALTAAFFGASVVPSSAGNVALSPAASVFAEIPTSLASSYTAIYDDTARFFVRDVPNTLLDESATWEQLWSYYNMGNGSVDAPPGVFSSANVVQARLPTTARTGLTPLVIQGKLFYRMRNNGGSITVDMNPLVVLANPYPFTLQGDFIIQFLMGPEIRWAELGNNTNPTDADLNSAFTPTSTRIPNALPTNGGMGNVRLVAKADGIPPGEAQIFTVDPDADLRIAHATTDTHEVAMIPSYDPTVFLTYTSPATVPTGTNVWVGLRTGTQMHMRAYMESIQTDKQFLFIFNQGSTAYSGTNLDTNIVSSGTSIISSFRVFPMPWTDGEKRGGGGVAFTLHDGYNRLSPQQSVFLGLNYRTMKIMYQGTSANEHPLEWSISYGFRGTRDQPYDTLPLDYYDANLLLPPGGSGIPNTTRWGLVNTGGLPSYNVPPPGFDPTGDTALVNVLYDLPQPGLPPVSLGQLQHFNLAGIPNAVAGGSSPQTWQLNYPIANSYITPRVPRDLLFFNHSGLGQQYDGAWLWNEILWDRFTFSSYPTDGDFDFDQPTDRLANARYRPFRSQVPRNDPTRYRGVHEPAKNLLVDGAFNINSTSVDAWKAVLAGLRGVPTGNETDAARLSAPFPRVLNPIGGSVDAEKGNTPNAWNGFRNLSDAELQALAEEIVLQVRLRGPFLSLADFTNRQLARGRVSQSASIPTPADTFRLGLTGAIQAALDRVINLTTHIPNTSNGNGSTFRNKTYGWATTNGSGPVNGDVEHRTPTRISGFPGFLLQGDVLSAIGPSLSARSDTFTIRTYGDTAQGGARVWCEAVVQRLPDFVDTTNPPEAGPSEWTAVNQKFGRRYEIVGFRWLTEEDI